MHTLKRSKDRKTANMSTRKGDQAAIANAFGLPAGKDFSCPGETKFCGSICYGKRIEGYLPSVSALLMHNWELVHTAKYETIVALLDDMITEFEKDCVRREAEPLFRIHWDGDFFSLAYAHAWGKVISLHPDTQFWGYTRNHLAAAYFAGRGLENFALYWSADVDNADLTSSLRRNFPNLKVATLANTFDEARSLHKDTTGNRVGMCPEVAGRIPLITTKGGACISCGLCPQGKTDITFAVSGR